MAANSTVTTAGAGFVHGFGPNPWDGTESWEQWNKDHPLVAGGN